MKFAVLLLISMTTFGFSGSSTKDLRKEVNNFLNSYFQKYSILYKNKELASWNASISGKKEDFDKASKEELELNKFHADKERFSKINEYLKQKKFLEPLQIRSLEIARLSHLENQYSKKLLEEIVNLSNDIMRTFNTYRAKIGKKEYTNNELLEKLSKEKSSEKRKTYWMALMQVGSRLAPKLINLAKLRNLAANELGYKNYWEMKIHLQEYEPEKLIALFNELDELTREPFFSMKKKLDEEISKKFNIKTSNIMPWHYDNPFFQSPPPSPKVDLDDFYKSKKKEDIVKIAREFYSDLGFDINDILERSDLYEKKGKDQHAFCTDIDRNGDVRTLQNVKPTFHWMDTMLHELGHAIDAKNIDRTLPFNLRDNAHIFTTEAIAMMFGALAQKPKWLIHYAKADPKKVNSLKAEILNQRRREQLIFARWTLVMFNFEKALYEKPNSDLNSLWWLYKEKYQNLKRPVGNNADWAAKPHFTIAPVYYHNYMIGELFAAQLRNTLAKISNKKVEELDFIKSKELGAFLKNNVFRKGKSLHWEDFVKEATKEALSSKFFAKEIQNEVN